MRALSLLAALLIAAMLLTVRVSAEPAALPEGPDPEQGLSEELVRRIGDYDGAVDGFGARFLKLLQDALGDLDALGLRTALRSLSLILAAALLCSTLEGSETGRSLVPLIGTLSAAAACTGSFGGMIRLGTQTIEELHRYTELLLPAMTPLLAASGGGASALAAGFGAVLLDLLLSFTAKVLTPMLSLLLVLIVAESAFGAENLSGLREFVRWLLVSAVKLLMWGYSIVVSVSGISAGAVDAQKLRALRSAIAGMVPVVGNLVSEASGSLLSAAGLLRTGVGLYGMLATFGICLTPFLRIALQYLTLRLAAALCALFGKGSLSPLLQKLTELMGLVLALTGVACLLCLMILVLCIRTVNL